MREMRFCSVSSFHNYLQVVLILAIPLRYCDALCRDAHSTVHEASCGRPAKVAPIIHIPEPDTPEPEEPEPEVLESANTSSVIEISSNFSATEEEGWNAVVNRLCEFLKLPGTCECWSTI